jgi:gamma-D-glutamyl-L-lysine dipeptidyl-peptidase
MPITDKLLIVTVPVADLRCKPVDTKPVYIHDDLQETQVLYNEMLLYLDEIDDWYHVEAIEQQQYTRRNIWQGYTGWIRKHNVALIDAPLQYNVVVKYKTAHVLKNRSEKSGTLLMVSIGTRLQVKETADEEYYAVMLAGNQTGYISKNDVAGTTAHSDENILRKAIVSTGRLFIDVPYLWGGRSTCMTDPPGTKKKTKDKRQRADNSISSNQQPIPHAPVIGVDCSGLTNLVYRANNIDIPRDAHEQWIAAQKVEYKHLKPGDLIFVSTEDRPDSIVHVMLNMGRERFLEAAETGGKAKISTFRNRFGENLARLAEHNFFINNKQIHFGRFISRQ